MAVDSTQIAALVTDVGLTPMLAGYAAEPTVRDQVCQIRKIDPGGSERGWRDIVIVGDNRPSQIRYGQSAPERTMQQGYTAIGRQRKLSQAMDIPEEIYKAPNARAVIEGMVTSTFGDWAQGYQAEKESIAAAVFMRGCIAAGDTEVFNGTYEGATDSNVGFIGDGKPLFAASGNGHPLYLKTSVTPYNLIASNALSATTLDSTRVLISSTNAVDDNNNPIVIMPNTLLVPPGLTTTAEVLTGSIQLPGGANNDINVARGKYRVVTWRYITDADGWFMGVAGKGVVFCDSGIPTFEVSAPDPRTGNIVIRMVSYCGAYARDWRYWFANNIATS